MNDIIDQQSELEQLKKQVELLTRIANKSKLARLQDKKDLGKTIKVTVYREDELSKPELVIGWKTVKNYVRTVPGKGIIEDQVVEIQIESDADPKEIGAARMQLGKLKKKLDAGEELSEQEQLKLEELNNKITQTGVKTIQMPYEDFFKLEKKIVDVLSTKQSGDTTSFEFQFDGKVKELEAKFIN